MWVSYPVIKHRRVLSAKWNKYPEHPDNKQMFLLLFSDYYIHFKCILCDCILGHYSYSINRTITPRLWILFIEGCFYWLLSPHLVTSQYIIWLSKLSLWPPRRLWISRLWNRTLAFINETKKIIGTIFWFKFLKACQTRDKKGRKESGFLNLLTKSFSRLKVLNWLTKKSFIQFGVSSYPHFKSPP